MLLSEDDQCLQENDEQENDVIAYHSFEASLYLLDRSSTRDHVAGWLVALQQHFQLSFELFILDVSYIVWRVFSTFILDV